MSDKYNLPIEKTQKRHTRTSKTGKMFSAGSGSVPLHMIEINRPNIYKYARELKSRGFSENRTLQRIWREIGFPSRNAMDIVNKVYGTYNKPL